jgi:anti-sigma-K factor RskA
MNHERHEELAALAALDLLAPAEQAELTAALAQHPELQTLIDALRESATALAHTAPSALPPAGLKTRLLANIAVLPAPSRADAEPKIQSPAPQAEFLKFENPKPETRNPKPSAAWPAWLAAACLALASAWLAQNYLTAQKAGDALRDQQALAELTLRSTQNQLEAERLIAKRELADARAALTARDARLAELDRQLKAQGDLANYKIATLASLAGNSPQALAIAVWNPASQQGVLSVQKLPALAADKDYQLWVIDPQYPAPVDAGVFTVDPTTGEGRLNFHPGRRIDSAQKFAISLERKGGAPKAEGPILFLGQ